MNSLIHKSKDDIIRRRKDRREMMWRLEDEKEEGKLLAKSESGGLQGNDQLESKLNSSKGGGASLNTGVKTEMENRMGADLSDVKIHIDSNAHQMSEGINAKAFTHGQDIYFKEGNFDTTSTEGKKLLAHELTHTQQQKNSVKRFISRKKDESNLELDANYYTNTDGVRITDHPQFWDTEGKYNLLPLGAQVMIIDLANEQSFNKVSEENKWVKVRLLMLPLKKIPGGMKQAFKRKEGWLLRHTLSTTSPEDTARNKENRLPTAPGAYKGISYYSSVTTFNFPKYEFSSAQLSLKAPPYELIPWCKKISGKTYVVAYAARDQVENRNVFVIGPDSVDKFIANPTRPFKDTDPPAKNANFPSAPNALQGIIPYSSAFASDFPKYSYSLGGNQFSAPPYTLTPWCVKINNKDYVVAYCATDYNKGRNEFIIGPDHLDFFTKNTKAFVKLRPEYLKEFSTFEDQAAYLLELMNATAAQIKEEERLKAEADKHWMVYSQKAVAAGMKGDWDGYWHYLKLAWVGEGGALRSADWYMYTITSIGHATVARPRVGGNIKSVPSNVRQVKVPKVVKVVTTSFDDVSSYVAKNGKLPSNFISKAEAKALGWDPKLGNLNKVAPGKSIGGDIYKNNTNPKIPEPSVQGRVWYEGDIGYQSGFRGSERIVFSNDGLIYKTSHYKNWIKVK